MRDDGRASPRVTYALIAINVLVFLAEQGQFTLAGSRIHGTVIDEGVLYRCGDRRRPPVLAAGHQRASCTRTCCTSASTCTCCTCSGMMLEPAIGSVRFAAIYFTSLLAGSFGALLATDAPSLGASGRSSA